MMADLTCMRCGAVVGTSDKASNAYLCGKDYQSDIDAAAAAVAAQRAAVQTAMASTTGKALVTAQKAFVTANASVLKPVGIAPVGVKAAPAIK